MTYTYQLQKDPITGESLPVIFRKEDYAFIPTVPGNSDYRDYLEWVEAGNTPEAAD
jgi:hypothetical protein